MFDFFFFKQNTAYEMRISDWSSDVCSSDLIMEKSLDVLDHDRANHRGRQEGNKKIAHEHDFAALPGQRSPYQLPKSRPEYPHNGQYGAELNDDLEHLEIGRASCRARVGQ